MQNGRGKLEAAALFWCAQLGHELARLAQDVILFSAEEYGYLVLPAELATGSSIMPHKRNPDLFELTRARAAAVEGDLRAVLRIKGGLAGGYHRDFQLLKEPLIRGLERTEEMLGDPGARGAAAEVDRARGAAALDGGALATDEVMRRVEAGRPFRLAYREVAAALGRASGSRRRRPASSWRGAVPPAASAISGCREPRRGSAARGAGARASGGGSTARMLALAGSAGRPSPAADAAR